MTPRAMAATLRRYRAEWRAALARRDYAATRSILGDALSAVSADTRAALAAETRALNELLALDRRLQDLRDGGARGRIPAARHAFAIPLTQPFGEAWQSAIDQNDHAVASRALGQAIAAVSRRMARKARSQQALIGRLRRLQRTPLEFSAGPARCAFCGGTDQPGIDSGRLFLCADCVRKASEILAEAGAPRDRAASRSRQT
ncbi:MAG TPA: hypothetical protein VGQ33_16695 [Vicinamibacteria bacterium]|nr:hypothetical protein [Vicinamibacteria bacterium]